MTTNELPEPAALPLTESEERKQAVWKWILIGAVALIVGVGFPDTTAGVAVAGIARFCLVLGVLVFVHEGGHYAFARWAGMKVNRFALGFPPWIYTRRYKGIDYSIGALPIGGMVDIAGLGSEEEMVNTVKGEELTAKPVRALPPHGQREFQDTRLGWRFWTLFAGPLMNFLFALILFVGLYSLVGIPSKVTVSNQVSMVLPGMPAFKAGVQANDRIVAVNGESTKNQNELVKRIRRFSGTTLTLTVERAGDRINLQLNPLIEQVDKIVGSGTERAAVVGILFDSTVDEYKKLAIGEAVMLGLNNSKLAAGSILGLVGRAVTFQMSPRERREVGGPVAIAQQVNVSAKGGWYSFIEFAAVLSLNLGLINLLPIPALDGGRILFLGYELVTRRRIDSRKESLIHLVGMGVVLAFMLFIVVRDVLPYLSRGLHNMMQG